MNIYPSNNFQKKCFWKTNKTKRFWSFVANTGIKGLLVYSLNHPIFRVFEFGLDLNVYTHTYLFTQTMYIINIIRMYVYKECETKIQL